MSITVTPLQAPAPVRAAPLPMGAVVKQAAPLFGDIAANTATPIPVTRRLLAELRSVHRRSLSVRLSQPRRLRGP